MILHGKDDIGIQKSGFLWKQTRNSFKPWKQYYFVLTRLCLICYHRGSNGIQGKNPKLKIDLSEVTRVELHTSVSKKRASLSSSNNKYAERQFSVYCGKKSILVVRCEEAEETQDWVAALQDTKLLCSNRKKVHQELRRASFKLHVEQNIRSKVIINTASKSKELPKVTYLNRTPWDERTRSVSVDGKLNSFHNIPQPFSPAHLSFTTPEKRCYTYNENIVLSTPDIPLAQITQESQRFTFPDLDLSHSSTYQLDLSKSFSSEDVRMVQGKTSWRQRRSSHCNLQRAEDADSGQGSEDSNGYSEGNGPDGNLLNITGNTSEGSAQEIQPWIPPRPGKIQWLKDQDIPKGTREPEIVFNPSGVSSTAKTVQENYRGQPVAPYRQSALLNRQLASHGRLAAGQTVAPNRSPSSTNRQPVSPTRFLYDHNFGSTSKLHHGKWSSDLDLVPEGQEVSMFRAREQAEFHTPTEGRDFYPSLSRENQSNACVTSQQNYSSQSYLGNRAFSQSPFTKQQGLRRYNLHDNGTYSVWNETGMREVDVSSQIQTDYMVRSQPKTKQSFERQNLVYRSLDSSISKQGHQGNGTATSRSTLSQSNAKDSLDQKIRYKEANSSSSSALSSPANQCISMDRRQDRSENKGRCTRKDNKHEQYQDYQDTECHVLARHLRRHKYHDYEEAETDFSGPDDGDTEAVTSGYQELPKQQSPSEDTGECVAKMKNARGEMGMEHSEKTFQDIIRHRGKVKGASSTTGTGISRGAMDVKYNKRYSDKGFTQKKQKINRYNGPEAEKNKTVQNSKSGHWDKERKTVYYV